MMNVKDLTPRKQHLHNDRSPRLEHTDDSALADQASPTQTGAGMSHLWNTTSRRIGSSLMIVILTLFGLTASANAAGQVPFTATGTAVATGTTKLPGGLTQIDGNLAGTATHLGNITGTVTRIQSKKGNFTTTAVLVGANGKDSVFIAISGNFESSSGACVLTSTGTYSVTGGTGAFANATGGGIIITEFDQCAGTATGIYTGMISQPNSG